MISGYYRHSCPREIECPVKFHGYFTVLLALIHINQYIKNIIFFLYIIFIYLSSSSSLSTIYFHISICLSVFLLLSLSIIDLYEVIQINTKEKLSTSSKWLWALRNCASYYPIILLFYLINENDQGYKRHRKVRRHIVVGVSVGADTGRLRERNGRINV